MKTFGSLEVTDQKWGFFLKDAPFRSRSWMLAWSLDGDDSFDKSPHTVMLSEKCLWILGRRMLVFHGDEEGTDDMGDVEMVNVEESSGNEHGFGRYSGATSSRAGAVTRGHWNRKPIVSSKGQGERYEGPKTSAQATCRRSQEGGLEEHPKMRTVQCTHKRYRMALALDGG
ncbi:uncharacterized protein Z518_10768 [Rhinocladiella mackenziei CBS 650.93]|uniref:Uncharacterized protein n=1 Tax=Rhinocladiella mackenziei CBS 650.93 TaxID=1442369 RepID=A0A0D2I9A3_9EURO|nr:uncharacterized protein Z518_10768 [Rhinocladiella mackenziei CBS 650.93]KIW99840.1 hypothetical protein Z518_10768 [Rhinocladiella mackenziei CBS 650.93]